MQMFVSGSLAYDRIMSFPGRFADHILPDKIHILNVCFMVDGLDERFGGTAGNIAYNLALLGEKPMILAAAGKDFDAYEKWLRQQGLSLQGIRHVAEEFTAGAYITTDKADNQITGFNPGAMKHPSRFDFGRVPPEDALAIISPGNLTDMQEYARTYRELNIPYIFDPGQSIPAFNGRQLAEMFTGAMALVSNDYELQLIMTATEMTREDILTRCGAIVTTLGEKGSVVHQNGEVATIPAVPIVRCVDPTGAGDAYRAGLLKGLSMGQTLAVFVLSALGMAMPSSPGAVGVFEAAVIFGLGLFGVDKELALAIGLLIHMMQYIPTTVAGLMVLLKSGLSLKTIRHSDQALEDA